MNEQITRLTYVLVNNINATTETTSLNDGSKAQLINQDDFSIKEVPINDIEPGEWFVFVEPTEVTDIPAVSVNHTGNFLYLCVKNNKNGSVDVKTTYLDFEKKIDIIGAINNMLKEAYINDTTISE